MVPLAEAPLALRRVIALHQFLELVGEDPNAIDYAPEPVGRGKYEGSARRDKERRRNHRS
jgi:hypothetical protein